MVKWHVTYILRTIVSNTDGGRTNFLTVNVLCFILTLVSLEDGKVEFLLYFADVLASLGSFILKSFLLQNIRNKMFKHFL